MSPQQPAPTLELEGSSAPGGRAAAVTPLLEAALVGALAEHRPETAATLAALNVEVTAAPEPGAPLRVRAWVDRATRTLGFVSGEVFDASGARIASGAGVFELGGAAPPG